jgi:outer membrane immunogenic protein
MTGLRKYALTSSAAVLAAFGLAGSALADGVGPGPVGYYSPPSWSGFYLGIHAGGAWSDVDFTNRDAGQKISNAALGTGWSLSPNGFVGGVHGGYQQQWGSWVAGVEVSISGGSMRDSAFVSLPNQFDDTFRVQVDELFMATGRLGYAAGPWLLYAKGGYAGGRIEASAVDSITNTGQLGTAPNTWDSKQWHDGWTVGGGVDYKITRNVSLGIEYNFINLDSRRHTANVFNSAGTSIGPASFDVDPDIQTVTARLTIQFDRDRPVPVPLK